MQNEIEKELCKCMTEANVKFLEVIALLEILSDVKEVDNIGNILMGLTQKIVKKNFNKICYCKKILNLH